MNNTIIHVEVRHDGNIMQLPVFNGLDLNRPMAIVDIDTIKRLAEGLNSVPLSKIKHKLVSAIQDSHVETLDHLVKLLEDEVAFHRSINIITHYEPLVSPELSIQQLNQSIDLSKKDARISERCNRCNLHVYQKTCPGLTILERADLCAKFNHIDD